MSQYSDRNGVIYGNAVSEGTDNALARGWFLGAFRTADERVQFRQEVSVKWGIHKKGDIKRTPRSNQEVKTLTILISGRFELLFRSDSMSVKLERAGDYVLSEPGTAYRWRAIEDAVVLTVRWTPRLASM